MDLSDLVAQAKFCFAQMGPGSEVGEVGITLFQALDSLRDQLRAGLVVRCCVASAS